MGKNEKFDFVVQVILEDQFVVRVSGDNYSFLFVKYDENEKRLICEGYPPYGFTKDEFEKLEIETITLVNKHV